jgi:hypothetical protein
MYDWLPVWGIIRLATVTIFQFILTLLVWIFCRHWTKSAMSP